MSGVVCKCGKTGTTKNLPACGKLDCPNAETFDRAIPIERVKEMWEQYEKEQAEKQ